VWYVLKLDPLEVAFELPDLSAVSVHCVFHTIPLLVDLLDDDLVLTPDFDQIQSQKDIALKEAQKEPRDRRE
jgi:hypothetical protein